MARLHEFQGKALLKQRGFRVPRGGVAATADEAARIAEELAGPFVVKIQAWTTGRAAMGGVAFGSSPQEAKKIAARLLAMKVGNFPVEHVLLEEKLAIKHELFVSLSIDDRERCPVILLSMTGGTGIEERAGEVHKLMCDVVKGPDAGQVAKAIATSSFDAAVKAKLAEAVATVFATAREVEARSVEINPLVVTADGKVVAADCRMTIDDYAVFRHPELGIAIARELDHPPTALEGVAYRMEQEDHRGTFYFAQMNTASTPGSKGLIGFHGAGGGGSMMSMDAITNEGFTIANFCDTSGNPSAAKVYRAAMVILNQPGLIGYFGSGSGVANQEQFWSAYGLAKAFWEAELDIPTVIRLGGNTEDRAVEILQSACQDLPTKVEGYKKSDSPAKIASRFAELVREAQTSGKVGTGGRAPRVGRKPRFVGSTAAVSFAVKGGKVWIDTEVWKKNGAAIVSRSNGLLRDDGGQPVIAVKPEEFLAKDSDMIACEVECRRDGVEGVFVELDLGGL